MHALRIPELRRRAAELWLARLDPQGAFTPAERASVAAAVGEIRPLRPREVLLHEGEAAERAFLMVDGMAARAKATLLGRRQIVSLLLPGDLANEDATVVQYLDHSVAALCPSVAALVSREALHELSGAGPRVALALRRISAEEGAITREWVLNVAARTATARIAHLICELAWRLQSVGLVRGATFDLPMTQQDLADATGMSTVHANRVLQRLRRARVLRFGAAILEIIDAERLHAIAEFTPAYLQSVRPAAA
jgi:CRP-like cAMP-binding protein